MNYSRTCATGARISKNVQTRSKPGPTRSFVRITHASTKRENHNEQVATCFGRQMGGKSAGGTERSSSWSGQKVRFHSRRAGDSISQRLRCCAAQQVLPAFRSVWLVSGRERGRSSRNAALGCADDLASVS